MPRAWQNERLAWYLGLGTDAVEPWALPVSSQEGRGHDHVASDA